MRFSYDLTIPAGTTAADPAETEARLARGTLFHAEIAFPPGPNDLVSVVVKDALLQILPANPEASFSWDDYTHAVDLDYELGRQGHTLTLVGWSPSCEFAHTITFRFDVRPASEAGERGVIEQLARLIGLPGR